jgi:cellulose synthase/poly-beta-1,6-N-acetylglucosamine synthase-like glycosyltransferase
MIDTICFFIASMCGIFSGHRLFLLGIYLCEKYRKKSSPPAGATAPEVYPRITVQLPIFNERYVVKRLIDAVCRIRYPLHLLDVQVLDDSDDETRSLIDRLVSGFQKAGYPIRVLRRSSRLGFKAGALQHGLRSAAGDWILIFDSDFIPQPDLLEKALPLLNDPKCGMVQFCWDHVNRDFSLLTRIQALSLDGHFHIEHFARNHSRRFFNFNGTAGIWRKSCIIESEGWKCDTLTEDLDLSYRAQMKGWRFCYAPGIKVPAELPIELAAFKSQQYRWAKGGMQTARKILPVLFRSDEPWHIKIEGAFHLLANTMYAVLFLMILSMPFLLTRTSPLSLYVYQTALLFSLISVTAYYLAAGLESSGRRPLRILLDIPLLMSVGIGLCINNSLAVFDGFFSNEAVFVRTPKYNVTDQKDPWRSNVYRIRRYPLFCAELILLFYLCMTAVHFVKISAFYALPYLALFIIGFIYFMVLSILETLPGKPLPGRLPNGKVV